ncbi:hypothetical protein GCM10022259_27930 [Aquimarina mytili]
MENGYLKVYLKGCSTYFQEKYDNTIVATIINRTIGTVSPKPKYFINTIIGQCHKYIEYDSSPKNTILRNSNTLLITPFASISLPDKINNTAPKQGQKAFIPGKRLSFVNTIEGIKTNKIPKTEMI